VYYFNDTETGSRFVLDTHPSSYEDAAASCRKYGAQPVAFDTYDEQYNAEAYYIEELVSGSCVCGAAWLLGLPGCWGCLEVPGMRCAGRA
jgi:hypothetical protein